MCWRGNQSTWRTRIRSRMPGTGNSIAFYGCRQAGPARAIYCWLILRCSAHCLGATRASIGFGEIWPCFELAAGRPAPAMKRGAAVRSRRATSREITDVQHVFGNPPRVLRHGDRGDGRRGAGRVERRRGPARRYRPSQPARLGRAAAPASAAAPSRDWTRPAAMAIPKEGYFTPEQGRYGPVYPTDTGELWLHHHRQGQARAGGSRPQLRQDDRGGGRGLARMSSRS